MTVYNTTIKYIRVYAYILIENHLKSCNLKFVLIKKVIMLRCHLSKMSIELTCQLKNQLKKCWSKSNY